MSPGFHLFGLFFGIAVMVYAAKTQSWWLITTGWIIFGIAAFRLGMSV